MTAATKSTHEKLSSYGWRWYIRAGDLTAHLAAPDRDSTACVRILTRGERTVVGRLPEVRLCEKCRAAAGLPEPNPRGVPPLELPPRRERYPGE